MEVKKTQRRLGAASANRRRVRRLHALIFYGDNGLNSNVHFYSVSEDVGADLPSHGLVWEESHEQQFLSRDEPSSVYYLTSPDPDNMMDAPTYTESTSTIAVESSQTDSSSAPRPPEMQPSPNPVPIETVDDTNKPKKKVKRKQPDGPRLKPPRPKKQRRSASKLSQQIGCKRIGVGERLGILFFNGPPPDSLSDSHSTPMMYADLAVQSCRLVLKCCAYHAIQSCATVVTCF
jgi:hypothetical protein